MTVREIERTNPFSTALAERGLQAALHKLSLVYGEARRSSLSGLMILSCPACRKPSLPPVP
jgi:hypothetical protein